MSNTLTESVCLWWFLLGGGHLACLHPCFCLPPWRCWRAWIINPAKIKDCASSGSPVDMNNGQGGSATQRLTSQTRNGAKGVPWRMANTIRVLNLRPTFTSSLPRTPPSASWYVIIAFLFKIVLECRVLPLISFNTKNTWKLGCVSRHLNFKLKLFTTLLHQHYTRME